MKTIRITDEQLDMIKSGLLALYREKSDEASRIYDLYDSFAKEGTEQKAEEEQK